MAFSLSNHQKFCFCIRYICLSSVFLVIQSINIYMSCEYRCLSKEMKLCVRHKHIAQELCMCNYVELYLFVCDELVYLK